MAIKKAHPGFAKVKAGVAESEGISEARAGAILAESARKASPEALKANPRLKKVSGVKKSK